MRCTRLVPDALSGARPGAMSVVGARAALVLADEIFLAVHQRAAFVVARMMDVRAVGLHVPGGRGVGHLQVHIANQLVDLLGRMLQSSQFVIDAGGDLLIHAEQPISVALEDPEDQSHAIGIAHIANGALCASAPSRRHWNVAVNERTQIAIHHLLNAIDGLPAQQTEASWAYVPANATLNLARDYPTAVADGLATALFVSDVAQLQRTFDFTYATLDESRQIAVSRNFQAALFLRSA